MRIAHLPATALVRATALSSAACVLSSAYDANAADDLPAIARELASKAERAGQNVVEGRDGWLFFAPDLRHIAESARSDKSDGGGAALDAIVDFAAQLKGAGVELLVAPVPPKALIYADRLPGAAPAAPSGAAGAHTRFLGRLDQAGVATLDLRPLYEKEKRSGAPLYCLKDTHWSGHGLELAARALAGRIRSKPWYAALPKTKYQSAPRTIDISGDLARSLGKGSPASESVALRVIGTQQSSDARGTPVPPDRQSPIVLLGDSHNLVFHAGGDLFATGAGLPDHLAASLGLPVDVVAVRGAGATAARVNLARRIRADPAYLARKKIVLWVFAARELTQSTPWQKVPVVVASAGSSE